MFRSCLSLQIYMLKATYSKDFEQKKKRMNFHKEKETLKKFLAPCNDLMFFHILLY
ncbi:hypothetical protein VCHA39O220_90040 [Vibrio chagasii]|nr:hypothetical protein VCHA39O220_90040 [Vibrio chagasii]CAH7484479.1 hypothetical protein VCHA39O224_80040 [Vibrio chagasii]